MPSLNTDLKESTKSLESKSPLNGNENTYILLILSIIGLLGSYIYLYLLFKDIKYNKISYIPLFIHILLILCIRLSYIWNDSNQIYDNIK